MRWGVDLQELRAEPDEDLIAAAEAARQDSGGEPSSPWLGSPRYLHKAYLRVLLKREFGSAYLVLDEGQLEEHVEDFPVEEVVVVISRRRRELEFVEGVLAPDEELHPQVHLFIEDLARERPGENIRILAARRTREPSEEGHERLTRAMREFSCETLHSLLLTQRAARGWGLCVAARGDPKPPARRSRPRSPLR